MAWVKDHEQDRTVVYVPAEGRAEISVANVNPTSAKEGEIITVTMEIGNIGAGPDTLLMTADRMDTYKRIIEWSGVLKVYQYHRETTTFPMPANDVPIHFEAFHLE